MEIYSRHSGPGSDKQLLQKTPGLPFDSPTTLIITGLTVGWLLLTLVFILVSPHPIVAKSNRLNHHSYPTVRTFTMHIRRSHASLAKPKDSPAVRKAQYATNRRFRFSLWLRSLFARLPAKGYAALSWFFIGGGLFLLGYFLISLIRQYRRKPPSPSNVSRPSTPQHAYQPRAYLKVAFDRINKGQHREALHALYLALAQSAATYWPAWRATDTPREWIMRLVTEEPIQNHAEELTAFLNLYERVWFGFYPTNKTTLRKFYQWTEDMLARMPRLTEAKTSNSKGNKGILKNLPSIKNVHHGET